MSDLWLIFLYKGFALVLVHVADTALNIDDTLKQAGNTVQIQDPIKLSNTNRHHRVLHYKTPWIDRTPS